MTNILHRKWPLASALLVTVALAVAGCGGGSSPSKSPAASSPPASTSSAPPATSSQSSSSGIPQGANAGDADSDNQGAPSDGDGNI